MSKTETQREKKGDRWNVRWTEARKGVVVTAPVVAIEGEGSRAKAIFDLGTRRAILMLERASWARKFSSISQTPFPDSVTEFLAVGDVCEVRLKEGKNSIVELELEQPPLVQGALVAIEPMSRDVLAMVGGDDFRRSSFIRAVQAKRQPGSAFKPILYAAAIHSRRFTPTSFSMDSPEIVYLDGGTGAWRPNNYEKTYQGLLTLRQALAHSTNTVAVKLFSDLGAQKVIEMASLLGIQSELKSNPSLALGTSEVTPLELVNAYDTFAAMGKYSEPVFILSVERSDGTKMEGFEEKQLKQAISEADAFVMTSLLKSVIEEGTGKKALVLNRPLGGKTGTTNEFRDAWFVGYSPQLVAGVWVGFDDHSRIGTAWAQGAGTALPIWIRFMQRALEKLPKVDFIPPEGVVFAWVDSQNGLLAPPNAKGAMMEAFVESTEPQKWSNRYSCEGIHLTDQENASSTKETMSEERLPEGLFH